MYSYYNCFLFCKLQTLTIFPFANTIVISIGLNDLHATQKIWLVNDEEPRTVIEVVNSEK